MTLTGYAIMTKEVCRLAKKKRKKKSSGATLTFEVYGIIILILSIIALAGQGPIPGIGTVGRAFNYIFLFLAGRLHFIIPIITIYIGLYAMIKRKWPSGWSYKKTGITVVTVAILGLLSLGMFGEMYPSDGPKSSVIFSQPYQNIKELLGEQKVVNDFNAELGGGFIGAVVFGALSAFFDKLGAQLILFALLAIGVLYLTGWSYVEFGMKIKRLFGKVGSKGKREIQEISTQLKKKSEQRKLKAASSDEDEDETDEAMGSPLYAVDSIDEENYNPNRKINRKKSSFFDLIRPAKEEPSADLNEEEEYAEPNPASAEEVRIPILPLEDEPALLVRDFQEHDDQLAALALDSFPEQEHLISEQNLAVAAEAQPLTEAEAEINFSLTDLQPPVVKPPYKLPPFHLLNKPAGSGKGGGTTDYKANARKLEQTLESFGVRTKVLEVVRGPAVTRYEIMPDVGVKVSRIVSLTDDIALALAAKDIRMEAPIPGKSAIGIEVPNTEVSIVTMREVMEGAAFHEAASKLSVVLGRDISGQPIVGNLAKMPHLLVAGATGSGKSVCINAIITSVLYKARPDEVKFLMIDPKMVELNVYNGIPHLLAPVVTDPRRASLALKKIVVEMEKRYELFSKSSTRNMEGYNAQALAKGLELLPYIVVIVDELADLMMVAAGDVEDAITRLAQMARAAGIHLIIATQRPSVDVITGVIKANIPSRIAFGVSSQVDSRTILDSVGAEKLLGRGDMLYLPVGESKPLRIQGAFLSDHEVESVVNYVSSQEKAEYREELVPEIEEQADMGDMFVDELFDQAAQIVLEAKQASVSLLQRRLRIGYTRAARLIDSMEAQNIIGPYEGSKPREVLMSLEQFHHNNVNS
jgi:S-DNA-T family DNA segregation ATPase FtsK/SpoIIIE